MKRTAPLLPTAALLLCLVAAPRAYALNGTILLGGPQEGWPPFFIPGPDGQPATGIMPDVLRTVANSLGLGVIEAYYPEKRGLLLLAEGGLDAWPKSVKWVSEPDRYLWTGEVVTCTDVLVYRRAAPIPFSSPKDLLNRDICVVHGYIYPTLEPLFTSEAVHRQNAPSARHMLRMLERGHADGAICNRFVADWILRDDMDLDAEDFAFGETPVDAAPYGFAFTRNRDWSWFVEEFDRQLEAMRADGRLDDILNRYR